MGMGEEDVASLREVGKLLAMLKEPEPPKGLKDAWNKLPIYKQVLNMGPKVVKSAPCQAHIIEGDEVDLSTIPVQRCWPGDAAPLVTWPLVITRGPYKQRQNLGIYRQQVIGKISLLCAGCLIGAVLWISVNGKNSIRVRIFQWLSR